MKEMEEGKEEERKEDGKERKKKLNLKKLVIISPGHLVSRA